MGETRQRYTKEFKRQAVELLNTSGKTGYQIEEELGVKRGVIYKWRKQLDDEGERAFPGNGNERDKELAKLRKENAELREEKEILRKAIAIFSDKNHR
jgi:transposase-like protein